MGYCHDIPDHVALREDCGKTSELWVERYYIECSELSELFCQMVDNNVDISAEDGGMICEVSEGSK